MVQRDLQHDNRPGIFNIAHCLSCNNYTCAQVSALRDFYKRANGLGEVKALGGTPLVPEGGLLDQPAGHKGMSALFNSIPVAILFCFFVRTSAN